MANRLVVGLGNPGRNYFRTRHNLGFWAVDVLAEKLDATWNGTKHKSVVASTHYNDLVLILAKPTTYMNLSGESVAPLLKSLGCQPSDLLVIYDDVSLPVGSMRLRQQGSAGGHHGIESIIASLNTEQFPRIKLGIKSLDKPLPQDLAEFVLSPFERGEEAIAAESVRRCVEAVLFSFEQNFEKAMNEYNKKTESREEK